MNTAVTSLPLSPATSAAGSLGASLRRQFKQAGAAVWSALEAAGRVRAQRHLEELAAQYQALQPGLARELRTASRQGPMA